MKSNFQMHNNSTTVQCAKKSGVNGGMMGVTVKTSQGNKVKQAVGVKKGGSKRRMSVVSSSGSQQVQQISQLLQKSIIDKMTLQKKQSTHDASKISFIHRDKNKIFQRKFSQPSLLLSSSPRGLIQRKASDMKENLLNSSQYHQPAQSFTSSMLSHKKANQLSYHISEKDPMQEVKDMNSKTQLISRHSDDLVLQNSLSSSIKHTQRRMSQTQIDWQISQIHQQQFEREQTLRSHIQRIKEVAQETMLIHSSLNKTQEVEARMLKFESMIDLLMQDRQGGKHESQLGGSLVMPQQTTNMNEGGDRIDMKASFTSSVQPMLSQREHPGVKTLTVNLNQTQDHLIASQATTQQFRKEQNEVFSRSIQHNQNSDQFSTSKSIKPHHRQNDEQIEARQVILTCDFNPSKLTQHQHHALSSSHHYKKEPLKHLPHQRTIPSQREGIEDFMQTLQTIEDYSRQPLTPKEDLRYLREKLIIYKKHLSDPQQYQEIALAIDNIIRKMDLQQHLSHQRYVELDGCQQTSVLQDRSCIFQNEVEDSQNQRQKLDTEHMDYEQEATESSLNLSTRKSMKRPFNQSDYQVKHSRYLSQEMEMIQHQLETSEETVDKSWLMEIKHLKALLTSITHNQPNDKAMEVVVKKSSQSTHSQCIIM